MHELYAEIVGIFGISDKKILTKYLVDIFRNKWSITIFSSPSFNTIIRLCREDYDNDRVSLSA